MVLLIGACRSADSGKGRGGRSNSSGGTQGRGGVEHVQAPPPVAQVDPTDPPPPVTENQDSPSRREQARDACIICNEGCKIGADVAICCLSCLQCFCVLLG